MTATFDPAKDAANIKKHGVSLAEGDGVLSDPLAVTIEDESAEGEQRFVTLGCKRVWLASNGSLDTTGRGHSDHFGSESYIKGKKDI